VLRLSIYYVRCIPPHRSGDDATAVTAHGWQRVSKLGSSDVVLAPIAAGLA
jgi:hypothetical protein